MLKVDLWRKLLYLFSHYFSMLTRSCDVCFNYLGYVFYGICFMSCKLLHYIILNHGKLKSLPNLPITLRILFAAGWLLQTV